MNRALRALGLALTSMLVLNALVTSGAMGSTPRLTTAEYPSILTAEQVAGATNELSLEGGRKVTCTTAKYTTEYTKAQSEAATWSIELTPEYSGCTATILGNVTDATLTINGCKVELNSETTVSTTEQGGAANVNCPGSAKIEIHVWQTNAKHLANETPLCTYTIGHQPNFLQRVWDHIKSSVTVTLTFGIVSISVGRTAGTVTNCGAGSQAASLASTIEGSFRKGGVPQTVTMDPS